MDGLVALGFFILISTLIEGIVEYFVAPIFDQNGLAKHRIALLYIPAIFGVLCAVYYKLDLVAALAPVFNVDVPNSVFGQVLTGILVGRGSNYVHQFLSKYLTAQG